MAAREGRVLWEPPEELLRDSKMARYMRDARLRLLRRAVALVGGRPRGLLGLALGALRGRPGSRSACSRRAQMPGAEWFPGAQAQLRRARCSAAARAGEAAIVHATESSRLAELSWDELRDEVARCAAGLRRLGVGRGDRVVAYMPNVPETVIAFLATASIGAIWSSCAPEFGTPTVIDRFAQIEPKVLLAIDGYRYGGKRLRPARARARDRARRCRRSSAP